MDNFDFDPALEKRKQKLQNKIPTNEKKGKKKTKEKGNVYHIIWEN
jgi:hypothetical protein